MPEPPPPYPKISELPPPGTERRRLLRQFGIASGEDDDCTEGGADERP